MELAIEEVRSYGDEHAHRAPSSAPGRIQVPLKHHWELVWKNE